MEFPRTNVLSPVEGLISLRIKVLKVKELLLSCPETWRSRLTSTCPILPSFSCPPRPPWATLSGVLDSWGHWEVGGGSCLPLSWLRLVPLQSHRYGRGPRRELSHSRASLLPQPLGAAGIFLYKHPTCLLAFALPKRACTHAKSLQSCSTLCDPMDCSPPGSSVHAVLQARILEWVAMASSRGIFPTQGSNPRLLHLLHWQVGSLH